MQTLALAPRGLAAIAALALGLEVPIEPPEVLQFKLEWQHRTLGGWVENSNALTIH